jgi:hypothetical protein
MPITLQTTPHNSVNDALAPRVLSRFHTVPTQRKYAKGLSSGLSSKLRFNQNIYNFKSRQIRVNHVFSASYTVSSAGYIPLCLNSEP